MVKCSAFAGVVFEVVVKAFTPSYTRKSHAGLWVCSAMPLAVMIISESVYAMLLATGRVVYAMLLATGRVFKHEHGINLFRCVHHEGDTWATHGQTH